MFDQLLETLAEKSEFKKRQWTTLMIIDLQAVQNTL